MKKAIILLFVLAMFSGVNAQKSDGPVQVGFIVYMDFQFYKTNDHNLSTSDNNVIVMLDNQTLPYGSRIKLLLDGKTLWISEPIRKSEDLEYRGPVGQYKVEITK